MSKPSLFSMMSHCESCCSLVLQAAEVGEGITYLSDTIGGENVIVPIFTRQEGEYSVHMKRLKCWRYDVREVQWTVRQINAKRSGHSLQ